MAGKDKSGRMLVMVESKPDIDGWNIPIELTYNEEKFGIKDPIRSKKLFNNAVRFKCNIDGKAIELFNEGVEWWILKWKSIITGSTDGNVLIPEKEDSEIGINVYRKA